MNKLFLSLTTEFNKVKHENSIILKNNNEEKKSYENIVIKKNNSKS